MIGWFAGTEPPLPLTWNEALSAPDASMSAVALQELIATGDDRLRLEMCRAKWVDVPAVEGFGEAVSEPLMVTACEPDSAMLHV